MKAEDCSKEDAVIIFSWSNDMIGPRVFLLHSANLTADLVPDALEAMDVVGHPAQRKEGWVFGPGVNDAFTQAVREMGRLVKVGRRAEIDGHLLAVAWYGDQQDRGRNLDFDLLGW